MHYRGFVIVSEPTREAVAAAMAPFDEATAEDGCWDWYRCGGRYDGYLLGEEEMARRETHGGFNFNSANDHPARNSCRVHDLPPERRHVYFFTDGRGWVEREEYVPPDEGSDDSPLGKLREVEDFDARLDRVLAAYPDFWVVVVDAHR